MADADQGVPDAKQFLKKTNVSRMDGHVGFGMLLFFLY
jgi:hypothetical protein